jgi:hypothetical protein
MDTVKNVSMGIKKSHKMQVKAGKKMLESV